MAQFTVPYDYMQNRGVVALRLAGRGAVTDNGKAFSGRRRGMQWVKWGSFGGDQGFLFGVTLGAELVFALVDGGEVTADTGFVVRERGFGGLGGGFWGGGRGLGGS